MKIAIEKINKTKIVTHAIKKINTLVLLIITNPINKFLNKYLNINQIFCNDTIEKNQLN